MLCVDGLSGVRGLCSDREGLEIGLSEEGGDGTQRRTWDGRGFTASGTHYGEEAGDVTSLVSTRDPSSGHLSNGRPTVSATTVQRTRPVWEVEKGSREEWEVR